MKYDENQFNRRDRSSCCLVFDFDSFVDTVDVQVAFAVLNNQTYFVSGVIAF